MRGLCLLLIALLGAGVASADTKHGWTRRVQGGVNVTEGNKDSTQTRAEIGATGRGPGWESELKLRGDIGELNSEKNREQVTAEAQFNREINRLTYMTYRLDFFYDGIAEIDYRVVLSPSLGRYLVRDDAQSLRLEGGPAGVVEKKAGEREAYPALRFAEYYEGRVTKTARLLQGIEYVPELRTDVDRYLVKAFVELKSDLDEQLTLHVRFEGTYDSLPAEGKEEQDTVFSTTLGYRF